MHGVLHQERTDATGRRQHDDGVVVGELGQPEDAHRRPAGADHGHGVLEGHTLGHVVERLGGDDRPLGVPGAGHTQVADDRAAEPRRVHAVAELVDHAGDLAAGDMRQRR